MFSTVYVSSAAVPFSTGDLVALLEQSRENNSRLGVTGMLLHKDGNFIQALEGDEATVVALVNRIERDARHRGIITLIREHRSGRAFEGWAMGFRDLNSAEARATPGFTEFLDSPLTADRFVNSPEACHRLLHTFRKTM